MGSTRWLVGQAAALRCAVDLQDGREARGGPATGLPSAWCPVGACAEATIRETRGAGRIGTLAVALSGERQSTVASDSEPDRAEQSGRLSSHGSEALDQCPSTSPVRITPTTPASSSSWSTPMMNSSTPRLSRCCSTAS